MRAGIIRICAQKRFLNTSIQLFRLKSDSASQNRKNNPYQSLNFATITPEEAVTNIVYNTPSAPSTPPTRHIVNCLLRNEPGVLARVSSVLAARDFNIESVIGAKTEVKDLSRMTIVLNEPKEVVKKVIRQLEDLVPVWAVLDYSEVKTLERELLMVKVSLVNGRNESANPSDGKTASSIYYNPLLALSELCKLFQGRVLDVCPESVILELSAKSSRVDAFLALLKPYGIMEAARSGAMAMPRSDMTVYSLSVGEDAPSEKNEVDLTQLPPG